MAFGMTTGMSDRQVLEMIKRTLQLRNIYVSDEIVLVNLAEVLEVTLPARTSKTRGCTCVAVYSDGSHASTCPQAPRVLSGEWRAVAELPPEVRKLLEEAIPVMESRQHRHSKKADKGRPEYAEMHQIAALHSLQWIGRATRILAAERGQTCEPPKES